MTNSELTTAVKEMTAESQENTSQMKEHANGQLVLMSGLRELFEELLSAVNSLATTVLTLTTIKADRVLSTIRNSYREDEEEDEDDDLPELGFLDQISETPPPHPEIGILTMTAIKADQYITTLNRLSSREHMEELF